jgi:hypothetical protein
VAVARILIVAGGCRGRRLAGELVGEGHALRVTTRAEAGRAAIEATGAECWIGTPARLGTLRGALENVTLACWLLGTASGSNGELAALRGSRLEAFSRQLIDTTVRGFVYEARGAGVPASGVAEGEQIVRAICEQNAIPLVLLRAEPAEPDAWMSDAHAAVAQILGA